ncbi:MAG: substrate-binding domain-containing protein [Candidatus Bathyarchaeota archaeon]|nr:MAG: substrate-binding domain-containing protein [Candidatus Bathyarchaeota archaeon]
MQKKTLTWIITLLLVVVVSVAGTTLFDGGDLKKKLVISTTTSLYDTELLDSIEEHFEAKYPTINLYFISAGTGLAITHAERGDADMILVHAPSKELAFLESGYGTCRKIVAYNFFAIAGPEVDPANIKDLSPTQALDRIVNAGRNKEAKWVSRGDDSGTHTKEKGLWNAAGFDWTLIREEEWYVEAGTGMGKTLQVAENLDAYALADMGTYLKYYKEEIITLKTLVTQGEELLNVYSAIASNLTRHHHINFEDAVAFIKFLISEEGQEIIASFGIEVYDQNLFYPAVSLLKQKTDPTTTQWIENYAFFDGYECPPEYWKNHPELYT